MLKKKQIPTSRGILRQGPESGKRPRHPPTAPPSLSVWTCGIPFTSATPWETPVQWRSEGHVCRLPQPLRGCRGRAGDMVIQEKTWSLSRSQGSAVEVSPSQPCACHLPVRQGPWAHLSLPQEEEHICGPVTLPALGSDKPSVLGRSYGKAPFPSEQGTTRCGLSAEVWIAFYGFCLFLLTRRPSDLIVLGGRTETLADIKWLGE